MDKGYPTYIRLRCPGFLVQVLVISRLDNCNILYNGLLKYFLQRLQAVQNAAARVITKCARDDSISDAYQTIHRLPVEQRVNINILMFKALHNSAPNLSSFTENQGLSSDALFGRHAPIRVAKSQHLIRRKSVFHRWFQRME